MGSVLGAGPQLRSRVHTSPRPGSHYSRGASKASTALSSWSSLPFYINLDQRPHVLLEKAGTRLDAGGLCSGVGVSHSGRWAGAGMGGALWTALNRLLAVKEGDLGSVGRFRLLSWYPQDLAGPPAEDCQTGQREHDSCHASFLLTDPDKGPRLSSERMYYRIFEPQKTDLCFPAW